MGEMTQAAIDVLAERRRQIEVEGWDRTHDDNEHDAGNIAGAAAAYALNAACLLSPYGTAIEEPPYCWPWDRNWWKPQTDPDKARRDLVKAGALILAEIERLDRAEPSNV